jgi:hypothetical protein
MFSSNFSAQSHMEYWRKFKDSLSSTVDLLYKIYRTIKIYKYIVKIQYPSSRQYLASHVYSPASSCPCCKVQISTPWSAAAS